MCAPTPPVSTLVHKETDDVVVVKCRARRKRLPILCLFVFLALLAYQFTAGVEMHTWVGSGAIFVAGVYCECLNWPHCIVQVHATLGLVVVICTYMILQESTEEQVVIMRHIGLQLKRKSLLGLTCTQFVPRECIDSIVIHEGFERFVY